MVLKAEPNNSKSKLIVNMSALSEQSCGYHHNEELLTDDQSKISQTKTAELKERVNPNEKNLLKAQENQFLPQNVEDMMKFCDENADGIGTPVKVHLVEPNVKPVYLSPSPLSFRKRSQCVEERPNIQELRRKYETAEPELATRSPRKSKASKLSRKSMVAQITKMFNSKITQLMRHNTDNSKYKTLNNELSPEAKPTPKSVFKPVPKQRTKLPIYRTQLYPSPFQSPRLQRKQLPKANCLVAEEVFRQLSVKDKALLYTRFIDDLSTKNPQFAEQAEYLAAKRKFTFGGVVNEKQASVKHLTQKMEAKCEFPKVTISAAALQQVKPHPSSLKQQDLEVTDGPLDARSESPDNLEDSTHLSSLTVVLKPSPKAKEKRKSFWRSKLTGKREVHILDAERSIVEPKQKRNNNQLHSTLKIDVYAPPKKIRRTHGERLNTDIVLQNLFYTWLKEKNGIAFDITRIDNDQGTVQIQQGTKEEPLQKAENAEQPEKSNNVERLLEDASAKLETADIEACPLQDFTKITHKDFSETDSSIYQAVLEVAAPLEVKIPIKLRGLKKRPAPPIPSMAKGRVKKVGKPKKGPAPPIPCASSASSVSSARQSDADEYESGLSCIPKPPENELQKSHDQNPNALSEHQLRVQASLQRLNIPDWFRHYNQTTARSPDGANAGGVNAYKPGNFSRKRTSESSGRWTGLNSKTTSLSSLGSQRSDRSPLLLSPSAHSHHGGQTSVGAHQHHQHHAGTAGAHGAGAGGGGGTFSRWSTSHLNSSQTSPSCSQRGSFSRGGPVNSSFISVVSGQSNASAVRSSFRQPYLGWRSQEKLSQRTPHERLASSLLSTQPRPCSTPKTSNGGIKQHPVTPEIQSSIKEVTSAIVHYVNDQTQQQRSRSTSPNSRKCWLESSFVGTRPLDSPQTPVIENTTTFSASAGAAAAAAAGLTQFNSGNSYNYNYNSNSNNNNSISSGYYNNSSATSSIYSATTTTNADVLRMNGLSCGVAPERSLSSASLEDVLASLLGLPSNTAGTGASTSDAYTRSTTGDSASESLATLRHMPQTATPTSLQVDPNTEQRLRRRSEGDAPKQQQQQQQQQQNQQQQQQQNKQQTHSQQQQPISQNAKPSQVGDTLTAPMRRVSLGDSSESNNKTTSELQIKCRNTKCDQTATPTDAKKYYKSCHNCSHLYCSRECRRAHWEKHRKACLHSRASNLCRQVLATCKDDLDSQRHLSLLARKGFLSQGRGVVRVLFRSAEAAEGFIKHGFQCMGEASYVRWPDLMPAEMGLELYSELLKLSTEYKPDSKMLIYVAICVVSEAPGTAQAPVKWERQLVSRCAKLKLCKTILAELEQQQQALQLQQPIALVAVPEPATEILILTFNPSAHTTATRREVILSNILGILSRRGVFLRKHYPEIYQRLQTYADGQSDKFQPVTLHPRDSQSGQSFVCIIMPVHSESGIIKMPSVADGGNRVNTIDVGAANALTNLADEATTQS